MERPYSADSIWIKDGILKNKLNIKDNQELLKKEEELLNNTNIKLNTFKKEDLLNLHYQIYKDLYVFAGKLRDENVTIYGIMPCQYEIIDMCLTDLLTDNFETNSKEEFAKLIAYLYSELSIILPFRDCNDQVIKYFLKQYGIKNGYEINLNNLENELKDSFYNSIDNLYNKILKNTKRIC